MVLSPSMWTFSRVSPRYLVSIKRLGFSFRPNGSALTGCGLAHNALVFGGRPPLDLVTSGSQDGLLSVRRFLDGARGGLYMQPNTIDEAFTPYGDTEIVFR